jgi:hypothetical protein
MLDRMIRVDHAGEFGANRIYEGQMAVLGKTEVGPIIQVNLFDLFCSWKLCYGCTLSYLLNFSWMQSAMSESERERL